LAADLSLTGIIRLLGEATSGLLLLVAVVLSYKQHHRDAVNIAMIAFLMMLSVFNIFMFYYDQFSAIFYATLQFLLLFITIRYKAHAALTFH
jgi:uncharacterized membrane protein